MIDLTRIEGFDCDAGNSLKSAEKHGVTQAEAEQVFLNEPLLLVQDEKHSASEPRFHALGQTDAGRRLHVSLTFRKGGALIRVISARDMSRKERTIYEQDAQTSPDVPQ